VIGDALTYIRRRLDAHLLSVMGLAEDGSSSERVMLVDGDKLDPLSLPQGTIGMLVAKVQEEREFREANRYQRRSANGQDNPTDRHHPDIHLELSLLFVANFKDYAHAWNQLTHLLIFFQEHPVFLAKEDKDLPEGIGRLANELCSPSLQEQNELWGALRSALRPSLLYRFRLLTVQGKAMDERSAPIQTVETRLRREEVPANLRSPPASDAQPPASDAQPPA
jgi:hypothetical protein